MSELDALLALSERVGRDPALVQGPGGNTSLKDNGRMLIKASGTWLAEAQQKAIMVPVHLAPLLAAIERDDPATETSEAFVVADANPLRLRPSIETTMHAVLPQRVVIHVHCVETIAWSTLSDAKAAVAKPLQGFDWVFVRYARPGRPLTRAILDVLKPGIDVLVLGNHGLVVAAETVADAEALLAAVTSRLRRTVRAAPPLSIAALGQAAEGSRYRPAADPAVHAIATDPTSFAFATGGSYYPDHVIFLGPAAIALEAGVLADAMADEVARPALPMLLVEGAGVLMHVDATAGAHALARCLADVTARLEPGNGLRRLTTDEEDALVNWDAEKYRQALDQRFR